MGHGSFFGGQRDVFDGIVLVVFNTNRRVRRGVDTPRLDLDAGVVKLTYLFAF